MVFGSIFNPAGSRFGGIFQNIGQRLGQIYGKAQESPILAPLLQKYNIPEIVEAGKGAVSAIQNLASQVSQAGQKIPGLARRFQAPIMG